MRRRGRAAAGCAVGPDYHRPPLDVPRNTATLRRPPTGAAGDASVRRRQRLVGGLCRIPTCRRCSRRRSRTTTTSRWPWRESTRRGPQLGSTRLNYLPQVSVDAGAARAKTSELRALARCAADQQRGPGADSGVLPARPVGTTATHERSGAGQSARFAVCQARRQRHPGGDAGQRLLRAHFARQSTRDHTAYGGVAREIRGAYACPARAWLCNRTRRGHRRGGSRRRPRDGPRNRAPDRRDRGSDQRAVGQQSGSGQPSTLRRGRSGSATAASARSAGATARAAA